MKRIYAIVVLLCLCLALVPFRAAAEFDLPREALLSSLYESDISTLRQAIDLGLVTCEELTAYYLERIEAYDDPFNCFITICDDALEVARQRDRQLADGTGGGLLFGIPMVIKDNMDLSGYVTTNGKKLKDPTPATANAAVVDYLLQEGAVIIAKTNMSTAAQSSRDSISAVAGETKNAYSRYMAAGGSSGGSSVAVSLNFAVASLGTDTNSSLRMPAALNGCVAMRPTFKMLSNQGIVRLNSTRDTPGAITRTVYDQALVLDALTQGQYRFAENLNPNVLKGMRIGVLETLSYPLSSGVRKEANLDPEVQAAFENALRELEECGAEIVPVSMSRIFTLSDATMNTNDAGPKDKLYKAFKTLLTEHELSAVIFPTYLSTPQRSGKDAEGQYWSVWEQNYINNCSILSPSARVPEITVPIGVHSLGAGMGMEIVADLNSEQLLLDIAYSYTSRFNHRQTPTGAPDTYAASNTGSLKDHIAAYELYLNPPTTEPTTQPAQDSQPNQPGEVPPTTQPEPADETNRTWIFLSVAVVLLLIVILLRPKKRRKKRRRRKNTSPAASRRSH